MGISVRSVILILSLACIIIEPVWALGMGGGGGCYASPWNPAEIYCKNQGGCPKSGNCYFPDGSYCDLQSFYNGTCPGKAYYEQALWNSEAYRFLYGDDNYHYHYPSTYIGNPASGYGAAGYGTASYWLSEANRLYLAGSYSDAVALYYRAVNLDPYLTEAWLNLGNSLYALTRYQESLTAYDAAIRLEPLNVNAWQGKGLALLALGRIGEANVALQRAKELQDNRRG